jgi:hypothetical protein
MEEELDMSRQTSASQRITDAVGNWDGVTSGYGSRGEFAFKVGGREIGHLHGDTAAHFVFNRSLWAELMSSGRVVEHPVFPGKQGPAARRIDTDDDVHDVIALMRLNYEDARARQAAGAGHGGGTATVTRTLQQG